MVILVVDNDRDSLCYLENCIKSYRSEDMVIGFSDSILALEYLKEHTVDVLFTEVMMADVTGFSLTKILKGKKSNSYVVFVTDSPKYAMDAWAAHVSGYLIKPIDKERIVAELDCVMHN